MKFLLPWISPPPPHFKSLGCTELGTQAPRCVPEVKLVLSSVSINIPYMTSGQLLDAFQTPYRNLQDGFRTFFFMHNIFQKKFQTQNLFGPKSFWTHNFFGPKVFRPKIISDPWFFFGPNFCLGLGDFHWRRGIKPFQAEHFWLKSCYLTQTNKRHISSM